ncbi:MAG: hypothetical protein BGO21_12265 [Dyadobacter sp. 50-39]|uniref:hypothetical protein n=1 Tax=Dyadobacter sp. 50-39 TaxID=1895756 RepID=UPI000967BE4B|nr:hypothetical protein [Dyadobacter sp. 50-39]OJV20151.1 MAG: hypothetical protein BGO21_12265 [Dyadobacter sp. 50-39]
MQTTFEIGPGEWTEGFWQRVMDSFGQRRVRVTVEEIDNAVPGSQYDVYLQLKASQKQFPPIKVDENIDLSRLADDANDVGI